jgi:hypothetical protein
MINERSRKDYFEEYFPNEKEQRHAPERTLDSAKTTDMNTFRAIRRTCLQYSTNFQ